MTILKLGSHGPDVEAWQRTLVALGYSPGAPDGKFGKTTEKATIQFQIDRNLSVDGDVGPATIEAAKQPKTPAFPIGMFDLSLRFIQASGYTKSTYPRVVNLIPLHVMQNRQSSNTAEAVGAWFAKPQSSISPPPPGFAPRASAHVGFDQDSGVQYVLPGDIAWGAPGANSNSYHVEHAGFANETDEDWMKPENDSMIRLSAAHVAKACDFFGIPRVRLTLDEVAVCTRDALIRKGLRGVLSGSKGGLCTHFDLTRVWQDWAHYGLPNPRTSGWWPSHTDPGPHFPFDRYVELLRG